MDTLVPQKAVTISDVALAAGVTKATVSYALSGKRQVTPKTRAAVLQAAKELGYRPNPHAQRLSNGGCHNTIGIFALGLDLDVGTMKIQVMQHLLSKRGFDVPVYAYGSYGGGEVVQQAELVATLRHNRPRAIICSNVGLQPDSLEELELYMAEGGVVVCYDKPTTINCDRVIFDREDNTYQAARHLLELGHRDIGFYINGPFSPDNPRLAGFCRALGEWGLSLRPEWLLHGGLYVEGGQKLAAEFLKLRQKPTGICVTNETAAAKFIIEVQRAGMQVPGDLSVVSHDDTPMAQCCAVPLTTISHPVKAIAGTVVEMLCSRLDGSYSGEPRTSILRGELVQRQSAASLKH